MTKFRIVKEEYVDSTGELCHYYTVQFRNEDNWWFNLGKLFARWRELGEEKGCYGGSSFYAFTFSCMEDAEDKIVEVCKLNKKIAEAYAKRVPTQVIVEGTGLQWMVEVDRRNRAKELA